MPRRAARQRPLRAGLPLACWALLTALGCGGPGSETTVCSPACPAGTRCGPSGCVALVEAAAFDAGAVGGPDGDPCSPGCQPPTPYCGPTGCVACLQDRQCPAGQVCRPLGLASSCVPGCREDARCAGGAPGATTCCAGACVDLTRELDHCGACGHACAIDHARATCAAGRCAIDQCSPGWADCNASLADGCEVDLHADPAHCGRCDAACALAHAAAGCGPGGCYVRACDFGWADCDGRDATGCETDVIGDPRNCGGCALACGAVAHGRLGCDHAACRLAACDPGYSDCNGDPADGCEVATATDPNNCGACGLACGPKLVCKNGGCTCQQCNFAHARSACINLRCVLGACLPGFGDCNGNPADGCEADLSADPRNCGACGLACGNLTPYCQAGVCSVVGPSCNDILRSNPRAKDGLYTIDPDGNGPVQPYQVYCDMTTDGGGWTAFFVGQNGSPNVFAHFEDVDVDCQDPGSQCLRRLPGGVTTGNEFLATCGAAAVKFNINKTTLTYFASGTQGGNWMDNSNQVALGGGADVTFAGQTWTGQGGNKGWIVSAGNGRQASTFSSSYNLNAQWDRCNGAVDTSSVIRLMYR